MRATVSSLFRLLLLFSLVCPLRVAPALAGVDEWTSNGPEGGAVTALAIAPANSNMIYAGTSGGGVYRSTDAGASWAAVNGNYTSIAHILTLTVDAANPNRVYAGDWAGTVYQSSNGGASWIRTFIGQANADIHALVIDPADPNIVYAGADNGISRSTDGTSSWRLATTGVNGIVWSLVADSRTGTLYAGSAGVFRSTNRGASWDSLGLSDVGVYSLALDGANAGVIYAATSNGVFKTTNAGLSWTGIKVGLTRPDIFAIAIDPANSMRLYAASYDGVFRSTDGAQTWAPIKTGLTDTQARTVAIDPSRPGTVYVGTYSLGVFKSEDGGDHWRLASAGLTNTYAFSVVVDRTNPNVIYAGMGDDGGIFKSTNGGGSWSRLRQSRWSTFVQTMVIDPSNPNTIYAGTISGGIYKPFSADRQRHAEIASLPSTAATVVDDYYGILKSTDAGATWAVLKNTSVDCLVIDPAHPNLLYAGTYSSEGVLKSTDSGATWTASGLAKRSVGALAFDPTNPAILYAGTAEFDGNDGVSRSTDGGATWTDMHTGLSRPIVGLAVDASAPQRIYAATSNAGVYKSTNGGASWQAANRGLGDPFTNALVIDPSYPNVVYVATEEGIYRTVDYGENWSGFVAGLTNLDASNLALDPTNSKRVYATTIGSGVVQQQITRPEIFSATYEAKKLTLSGRNFADAVRVLVNNTDRSDFLVSVSETGILLKGKAKKLGLRSGTNTITVIDSRGKANSFFTFEF